MLKIKDITDFLEERAPLEYQESYDNAGLIVGNKQTEVTGILISIDCVEDIIDEAIDNNCNLVVAHHPIVFRGLKKINGNNYVERTIIKAIKNDIAIYAIHTNLDNIYNGVSTKMATMLKMVSIEFLNPKINIHPIHGDITGSGMFGRLNVEKDTEEFLREIKTNFKVKSIKHTKIISEKVQKIAVCGGAGSFLLPYAIESGADMFITSDFTYHQFFDAEDKIIIVDIGHYESEQFTKELIFEMINTEFPDSNCHMCETNTNPIKYF